jgi:hypothetical protein
MEQARARSADLTNKTLERLGREERVGHRSYVRRGIEQEAGRHFGPAASHMVSRGQSHDRFEIAARDASDQQRLEAVDRAIADLETERQALIASEQKPVEWEWTSGGGGGPTRDENESRSR